MEDFLIRTLLWLPAMLFALTVHEFAHGYVAYLRGDPTAAYYGRLTLNPIKHIDPIGFIALLLFHVGWAKPVPVNPHALKNPRRDALLVALAGPGSNFATAIVSALLLKLLLYTNISQIILAMVNGFVFINIALGLFNLIPLPPMDGWRVVEYFWPNHPPAEHLFPLTLVIILIVFNFMPGLIMGPIRLGYSLLMHLVGIP